MIVRARAPMRISFAGGGTEIEPYLSERGGVVLSTTIDRYVQVGLRPESMDVVRLFSLEHENPSRDEEPAFPARTFREKLVTAAIQRLGLRLPGFSLYLTGEAPPGSGLGSSSALAVAVLGVFRQWQGFPWTPANLAELAYVIERQELGLPGGKQDQYAAAFGGFNRLEFTREGTFVIPMNLSRATLYELHSSLLLCYIGRRAHRGEKIWKEQMAAYARRDPRTYAALDTLKSITYAMERALYEGRLTTFGELLHEAWLAKQKLAAGIATERVDRLYELARRKGALGGKILGAGGGGHLLLMCPFTKKNRVAAALAEAGARIVPFDFTPFGVQTWQTL
ncbi:MAG: GHMP kinase [Firmicutes bacterium]|nr:GHMP kinase [Bacillota bacterium]